MTADTSKEPEVHIISIRDLPLDKLRIPYYQRPYEWRTKQVNQLLNDLILFQKDYRLGTLVLHKNTQSGTPQENSQVGSPQKGHLDIVDGQQRLLTLAILLNQLLKEAQSAEDKEPEQKLKTSTQEQQVSYAELDKFRQKLNKFCDNLIISDPISIQHIKNNKEVIKSRLSDFKQDGSLLSALDFILNHCRFVEIILCDLSEAFQFFNSQNARGKAPLPHDLLKAFHLREIPKEMSPDDKNWLKNRLEFWEKQPDKDLHKLFLQLYRIRRWIYQKSGKSFTYQDHDIDDQDIDVFKGFSLPEDSMLLLLTADSVLPSLTEDSALPSLPDDRVLPCQTIFLMAFSFIKLADKNKQYFPHQLDQTIINGILFFDLVEYCTMLQQRIRKALKQNFKDNKNIQDILTALENYEKCSRNCAPYARELFDTALLYYCTKFGFGSQRASDHSQQELHSMHSKNIEKIFAWVYLLRCSRRTLKLAAVDSHARKPDSFFVFMHQASHPRDLLNWNFKKPPITPTTAAKGSQTKLEEIKGILCLPYNLLQRVSRL